MLRRQQALSTTVDKATDVALVEAVRRSALRSLISGFWPGFGVAVPGRYECGQQRRTESGPTDNYRNAESLDEDLVSATSASIRLRRAGSTRIAIVAACPVLVGLYIGGLAHTPTFATADELIRLSCLTYGADDVNPTAAGARDPQRTTQRQSAPPTTGPPRYPVVPSHIASMSVACNGRSPSFVITAPTSPRTTNAVSNESVARAKRRDPREDRWARPQHRSDSHAHA